jgi:hypothetical protein
MRWINHINKIVRYKSVWYSNCLQPFDWKKMFTLLKKSMTKLGNEKSSNPLLMKGICT